MPENLIYRFHDIPTKEYACTSGIRNSKKCILPGLMRITSK